MRIFLPFLLVLALPTRHASLSGSGAGVEVKVCKGVSESPDIIKAVLRACILICVAYLPALRVTGEVQALVRKSSPPDFWEIAKEYEKVLHDYVPRLLGSAATYFESTNFTDITSSMNHIVSATTAFRDNIKGALDAHHITFDIFTEELEGTFMTIVNKIENIPLPDKASGHAERAEMVEKVLDDTERELKKLAARYEIEEDIAAYLMALKPRVKALIVTVSDINEQYPQLLPVLAFSVAALLVPESWILRPFLSMFGFGPMGPVKGSTAALLQSRFWGAAVDGDSWFSWLQAAGMGAIPTWGGLVTKVPLLVGGLLAMLLPCCNRG
ncbi:hypothetical protein OG21DRAFT_1524388 [Imleria badia]|nr:hypothetical protein OG21DRAFT_1524388 [Imleria badia]